MFSWLSGQERPLHRGDSQPCAELKERQLGRAMMPMPWHLWKPFWATHVLADLPHLSKVSSTPSLSPTSSSGWEETVFTSRLFFARAVDTLPNCIYSGKVWCHLLPGLPPAFLHTFLLRFLRDMLIPRGFPQA